MVFGGDNEGVGPVLGLAKWKTKPALVSAKHVAHCVCSAHRINELNFENMPGEGYMNPWSFGPR